MSSAGMGATEIAEVLLGRKTQESTVRDFLSKVDITAVETNKPKVLFWDIETSPHLSAHFRFWDVTIGKGATFRKGGLLSHAWAWGDGEVHVSVLNSKEAIDNDYERIVREAWSLLDNADIVVAHNGKKFDIKKLNAEFLKLGLKPPSPYKVYDTLRAAKKSFMFDRNDLDSLCETLNIPYRKVENEGMPLWLSCVMGDQDALQRMAEYNVGDIPTLRALFRKLLPWDNQGINFALYTRDMNGCPHCGQDGLEFTGKFVYTASRKYDLYSCSNCGANARSVGGEGGLGFTRVC
jgi:uncharacterized protein YprB with RNaseH-like and TPR domain